MQTITITIQQNGEQAEVGYIATDGVTPQMGESACRFVAEQFRRAAIEAEVQRRVAELAEQEVEREAVA